MRAIFCGVLLVVASIGVSGLVNAQEAATEESVKTQVEAAAEQTREKVEQVAAQVDKSDTAKEASAGILKPIYLLAEELAFPAFHWVAFTLMVAGAVSYAFQLVLTKLVVLGKGGFSPSEILSDALGLAVSLIGLVLTTQAATENSTFTESPAAVLSATVLGGLIGFVLYRWGQATELQAVVGRTRQKSAK